MIVKKIFHPVKQPRFILHAVAVIHHPLAGCFRPAGDIFSPFGQVIDVAHGGPNVLPTNYEVTISIPGGELLFRKGFKPRLGFFGRGWRAQGETNYTARMAGRDPHDG